jgi:uncharacterized membrane protein YedE/YeeE
MTMAFRTTLAALVLLAVLAIGMVLHGERGPAGSFIWLAGAAFGIVLQRARFCFLCNIRDFRDARDARGLFAILAALAVGTLGYFTVFGAWLPDPGVGRLPPTAHIGPVAWPLALAGLAFGLGMAVSGSCLSAHFYRLGEGSPTAPFAIIGAALGFGLGFLTWNPLYLSAIQAAPVPWIPSVFGYGGALALQLAILAALGLFLFTRHRTTEPAGAPVRTVRDLGGAILVRRWPAWAGGIAVGAIATVAFLRVSPLGVTAELGRLSRTLGEGWQALPLRLEGLDTFRGCATALRDELVGPNGLFVLALILGALAAALPAGAFKPRWPTFGQMARGLSGGVLLGWGAMTALGCTIGNLLSGIMAGAVSGWVFALTCITGVWLGLALMDRFRTAPTRA